MTGTIRFDVDGPIGLATIDRPERKNALNAAMCDEFVAHLAANAELRAVVITGAGDAFCSGADLVTRIGSAGEDTFRSAFERLQDALVDFPAPIIAAIDGPALGAGTQLLTACDIRIARKEAKLGIPAARLGIVLSAPNLDRLVRLVGQASARDLLFTARVIDGNEALALGLVDRVVKQAESEALILAHHIAQLAPLSVQGHKRALNLLASDGLTDATRAEINAIEARAFASDDLQEGVTAFQEKRPPEFRGH